MICIWFRLCVLLTGVFGWHIIVFPVTWFNGLDSFIFLVIVYLFCIFNCFLANPFFFIIDDNIYVLYNFLNVHWHSFTPVLYHLPINQHIHIFFIFTIKIYIKYNFIKIYKKKTYTKAYRLNSFYSLFFILNKSTNTRLVQLLICLVLRLGQSV